MVKLLCTEALYSLCKKYGVLSFSSITLTRTIVCPIRPPWSAAETGISYNRRFSLSNFTRVVTSPETQTAIVIYY